MRTNLRRTFISAGLVCALATTVRADGTYQTANLFQFDDPTMLLGGAATLYRYSDRLEVRVATSGLNENSAYTVWWVIFNNPAACVGGCGEDDLFGDARATVFYAAGFVTGGPGKKALDGAGNVSAYVNSGALPTGVDVVVGSGLGYGLEAGNGYAAEVHIVVRTHGTINPGMVDQQIGSFNGGCNPTCSNVQGAIFPVQ